MADPVLERDLQMMTELGHAVERGDLAAERCLTAMVCKLGATMTKWQWVIHGETTEFRKVIVRWLCNKGDYTLARRFALCGRGDLGMTEFGGDGVRVKPMGCGCRFCPRCSRRFGARFLRKVGKHLEAGPHGSMWHVVLTQRVQRSETLIEARERFAKAWKRFYPKLRKRGMSSALCTYHVTASLNGGWHYHCHLLVEWVPECDTVELGKWATEAWQWAKQDSGDRQTEVFAREVCEPGPAFVREALGSQGELWNESRDPVVAAIQYVVRDVLQGVEKWVAKVDNIEDASTFAEALTSAKLHRLYGVWRKQLPKRIEEPEETASETNAGKQKTASTGKAVAVWIAVGRMDEVLWGVKSGDASKLEFTRRLVSKLSNKGMVSKRLRKVVNACCG